MKAAVLKPFSAEDGFKSPGFTINENGDLVIDGSITFSGELVSSSNFTVNGTAFQTNGVLDPTIVESSLTTLGTLQSLTVNGPTALTGTFSVNGTTSLTGDASINGNLSVTGTSEFDDNITVTGSLTVTEGDINLTSTNTGTIDNVNIGSVTRGEASFTALDVDTSVNVVPSTTGTIENVNIGATTAGTGRFSNVKLTSEPTVDADATTKKYVDTISSALAIALGS